MTMLTAFDWVLIAVVVVSTLGAFRRGFIGVLGSLAGLAAGLVLASWNYAQVAVWLEAWLPRGEIAELSGFLLVFTATMVAFAFVARLLRSTATAVGLGWVDRVLGAIFGLIRGVLIDTVLMTGAVALASGTAAVENSRLAPYFLAVAHEVSFVVPKQMQRQIADGAAQLLERGQNSVAFPWPSERKRWPPERKQ